MSRRHRFAPPRRMAGLSLVELMLSLVLGLMVVGAAITVFLSNRQTYAATESLGRIQETSRVAFEVMTRDVREAGGTPCDPNPPIVNVLDAPTDWWSQWTQPLTGYEGTTAAAGLAFGTAAGQRITGTDAVELRSAHSNGVTVSDHQPASAQFKVNKVSHGLDDGDIAMVCDFDHAAIFQVTSANSGTNDTIVHNTGGGHEPGNATTCLSMSGACPNVPGGGGARTYSFGCFKGERRNNGTCVDPRPWPGIIARLEAARWYIGNNGRGGRSLFRSSLRKVGGALTDDPIEVAENVQDMQLTYLSDGNYVEAGAVTDWSTVRAVRVRLTLLGTIPIGTDGQPLQRWMQHTIALRNRT